MPSLYVMGVDGSGKSTLARALAEALGPERVTVIYAQHRPLLLAPIRWIVRRTVLRGESEDEYGTYRTARREAVERHGVAATLYVMAWFLDYVVTTWPRMSAALLRRRGRLLIIDRYYVDQAVNMSVTLGHDRWIELLTRVFELLLPAPSHGVLLEVSGTVAYSRKDDIDSVEYLEERQELYQAIARKRGYFTVNADQAADRVLGSVSDWIVREGLV